MFKKTLLSLVLATAFSSAHANVDFDLNDLVPATAPAAEAQAVDTSAVKEVGDIIVAEDPKAAVLVAHQSLIEEEGDGVKMIAVSSGIGILSTGSGSYNLYENRNATLLSKRAAYMTALQIAKKQLVENLEGMQNQCETVVDASMDMIDSGTDSLANTASAMADNCSESVSGAIAGYVTFDVYDDPEEQFVRVSLISTPKTREQTKRQVGALTQTTAPNVIFKQIINDLQSGIMPPVGAKVITNPDSGESYVMGFGSSIIRTNSNKNVQRKLLSAAKSQSQTKARNALIATMQGDKVFWEGSSDEMQSEENNQFNYHPDTLDPKQVTALGETKHEFINQFKQTDSYKTIAQGKVPPGVSVKNFKSSDGDWMLAVAIYAPSLEAVATKAAAENKKRVREGQQAGTSHKINSQGGLNNSGTNSQGPSGQVSSVNDL
ncbi:hypothetical protein [Photobacterium sanguinicancri]|uniref:Curli production assembly/transport component CsgG n=1 Tax=Photobacterium sanguinicancri TaxID=875932 RepID=A0ABX4FTQ1_9GAMM|nr:hypothetical protein [Photobacterium sanguinicancri]MDO6498376.1 hypothetical protein [Photobacterium sanguinicancri]OZS42000.1 hypothetical protein ASV53_20760 [Photobacterium sanguinicancri]